MDDPRQTLTRMVQAAAAVALFALLYAVFGLMISRPAPAAVPPSGYIATTFYPLRFTATDTEASYTVPNRGRTTHLLLVNTGANNIYFAFEDRAVDTATDFYLEPNEPVLLPIETRTFRYITATGTSTCKGGALR